MKGEGDRVKGEGERAKSRKGEKDEGEGGTPEHGQLGLQAGVVHHVAGEQVAQGAEEIVSWDLFKFLKIALFLGFQPRKGKPGLLARTIILKSWCILMMFLPSRAELLGTIFLPSESTISPASTSDLRMQVTLVGALSASSTTST